MQEQPQPPPELPPGLRPLLPFQDDDPFWCHVCRRYLRGLEQWREHTEGWRHRQHLHRLVRRVGMGEGKNESPQGFACGGPEPACGGSEDEQVGWHLDRLERVRQYSNMPVHLLVHRTSCSGGGIAGRRRRG